MHVFDFKGEVIVSNEAELLDLLKSVRRSQYGAFNLYHANEYPMLSVHLSGEVAYLHYFPSDSHAGYQACDMTPKDCFGTVRFLQVDGSEADAIDMPATTLVSAQSAYQAAMEFLNSSDLPESIKWFEL